MKKISLICFCLLSIPLLSRAQTAIVQGKVQDADGEGLPGVTIIIKDAGSGTVTDMDGQYKLEIENAQSAVLLFSFVGYETKEVPVNAQSKIDVIMNEQLMELGEVIVTAMNIRQDKRVLNYAIQDVKAKDITESQQQNIVNSLQGKIAGVVVTSSSGSPGSSSSIMIRGGSSVSENRSNEPLFIIDGIIMNNSSYNGSGNAAMDINPDDIESMSVLKGPAAAALYGIGAGNGAIIITTKSGKSGKIQVNFGSTIALDIKNKTHEVQNKYGRGTNGIYDYETTRMYGPAYVSTDAVYDNLGEFFQTGVQQKYDLSLSGGSEKSSYYVSVSNNNQTGIIPGETYNRFNYLLKGSIKLRDNMKVVASSNNIISNNVRGGSGSMITAYRWPTDDNMKDYLNPDGTRKYVLGDSIQNIWNNPENPYWALENNLPEYKKTRNISNLTFDWDIIEPLKLTYRVGVDQSNRYYRRVVVPKSTGSRANYYGKINESELSFKQYTTSLNITFSKTLNDAWNVYALAGTMVDMMESRDVRYSAVNFLLPVQASVNNSNQADRRISQETKRRRRAGVYGEARLAYKGIASIGVTARNDWTSTIDPSQFSFFYPSVSAGFVFTELMGSSLSSVLSYGKLRANWARSGQDADPEVLHPKLVKSETIGEGYLYHYQAGNRYLVPEFLESREYGINLVLFEGMFDLDLAHYVTKSSDMIITTRVSPASGFILQTFNSGDIENKGWEAVLNAKVKRAGDLKWNASFNFARNRSSLVKLPTFISRYPITRGLIVGAARPATLLNEPLYGIEGVSYLRDKDGNIVIGENGYPRRGQYTLDENGDYVVKSDGTFDYSFPYVAMGNREPDWTVGVTNSFEYKRLGLSFLIDIKKGGDVVNATAVDMYRRGTHKSLEKLRNTSMVFKGVVETSDGFVPNRKEVVLNESYFRNNYSAIGENIVEDGSWVKLRYVALSYDLSDFSKALGINTLRATLTGRNLFMLTRYSGGDPENDYGGSSVGGGGTIGLDYYNVPTTRGVTFSLKATF